MAIPILKDYPVKINNTAIPFSGSMAENYDTIETVNQSEAGTDVVQVARLGKMTLAIEYTITSEWIAQFEAWAFDSAVKAVKVFDFGLQGYKERQMRMRNYQKSLVKHSQDLTVTTGIWKVKFDLIEL